MFALKKIVSQFFFPMPLCLFVCFAGLTLLWFTARQKTGRLLVTLGLLTLTAFSYAPVADALVVRLERQYPMYVKGSSAPVKYVVVLGGGHHSDPALPITSQIGDETLKRLIEGIRVYRDNPGSKLVLSGGRWIDPVPEAKVMADVAKLLGINEADLILEAESRDTREEARLLAPVLGTNQFALVTSATHLPRSMALFQSQGLNPQPVPAEHLVKARRLEPEAFFPNGRYLRCTERAFYEAMGDVLRRVGG